MTHQERIELINELARHGLAFVLITGFLGLTYVAVLGYVNLESPTIAGFLGTILGAIGVKIEPPIVDYFGRRRIDDPKPEKKADL